MTRKRTGEPWMKPADYGRTLAGLTVNLLVCEIDRSLPFYREVLGFRVLYHDPDFAALEHDAGARIQLHADHTFDGSPFTAQLASGARRGLGAEIRILGIEPEPVERAARERGVHVPVATQQRAHGWREVYVEDPDGYVFVVGVSVPA